MSRVTNVIIATGLGEDITYLKSKFKEFNVNGLPFNLVSVDNENLPKGWYGGSKLLEVNLFIGAYNYLDLEALIVFMQQQVNWEDPISVQLFAQEQNDFKFKAIDLFPE